MRTKAIGWISKHKTVWWKVDLGGVYNIYSITILFKNYDGFGVYFRIEDIYWLGYFLDTKKETAIEYWMFINYCKCW